MCGNQLNPFDLLSSAAVRTRCCAIYDRALNDKLLHFTISPKGLAQATNEVARVIRGRFANLTVPLTSRWLHLSADRRELLKSRLLGSSALERAKSRIDFIIISVLTDAGAGANWCYQDTQKRLYSRSEGLAQAGFDSFVRGDFSSLPADPLRVDAAALKALTPQRLSEMFQVSNSNPMMGLDGRAALLNRLGQTLPSLDASHDDSHLRPAILLDHILEFEQNGSVQAADILKAVLNLLGPIWPDRPARAGVCLGDTWIYPPFKTDQFDGLIPFHKLSQWLSYSLFDPLIEFGFSIAQIDDLTALAEYRNGGLLLDCGAIVPRDSEALKRTYSVADPLVIEWRALTVAMIDILADQLRTLLGLGAKELPLASVIEGGTWAAGREVAARLRPSGASPIKIESDGTVF